MKLLLRLFIFLTPSLLLAQDAVYYKTPPKEISDILLAKPTPSVSIDDKGEWMLLSERNSYPTVEELGQPEARIAGLRINPNNYSLSRQTFINNFTLKNIASGKEYVIKNLPKNLLASNVSWSPNNHKIAFLSHSATRIDLYVIDVVKQVANKVNLMPINGILGSGYLWVDDQTILYKATIKSASMLPKKSITPNGPVVQENYGKAAPSRTYQDLIKSGYDEQLFEFFATSQLIKNINGKETKIGSPKIYNSISLSPDKKYLLTRTTKKPFSYLVPAYGFNSSVNIIDLNGKLVKHLTDLPSSETAPAGFDNVQNVARAFDWRDDEPSTVTFCKPLDEGLYKNQMEYHDAVFELSAPFSSDAKEILRTKYRFSGITWGTDKVALVSERLQSKQLLKINLYNPKTTVMQLLLERNTTDAYNNPGNPVTIKNKFGRNVIAVIEDGTKLLMNNTSGSSPKGDLPYLATFDLTTKNSEIIWRSSEGTYEMITDIIDVNNLTVLTRKESQKDVPNYFKRNLKANKNDIQITQFSNPYPQLEGISKQKIQYKRADGIDLTGDLYLPKGYDVNKDGPLPVFIWAYPREFNSAADAAQIRGSQHRFTTIGSGSIIYYITQGYAILDNAEMPIVSKDANSKPNDNFIQQLKLNAEAAINALSNLGVGDKNRVAVGGHSYGAFMTAHLLSHTNLFKAGIARSGAYNRTLTPFGFQAEDRTYWQDPQLYYTMSPFSYANKIKTPLLMIHGDSDDNSGTFPIQSERLFNAIKGHGGTVRFVSLPYEAHGYRGKENLLHMLWEQYNWLEKYVKNAK
jgi:dipeptidyl aminopeptidase/acylaminoacyl peptidase